MVELASPRGQAIPLVCCRTVKCYFLLCACHPTVSMPIGGQFSSSVAPQDPRSVTPEVQHRCPDVRRFMADGASGWVMMAGCSAGSCHVHTFTSFTLSKDCVFLLLAGEAMSALQSSTSIVFARHAMYDAIYVAGGAF